MVKGWCFKTALTYAAMLSIGCVAFCNAASASPSSASDVVREVEDAAGNAQRHVKSDDYQHFYDVIARAYSVGSVSELTDNVSVVLLFRDRSSGKLAAYVFPDSQPPRPAASAIKVVLAVGAAMEVNDAKQWNTPVGQSTLGGTVRSMIAESNNDAANRLLKRYGANPINSWLGELGFSSSDIHFGRKFGDFSAKAMTDDNRCSALGLACFYELLDAGGSLSGFANRGAVGKILSMLDSRGTCNNNPHFNDRLNKLTPEVSFFHKTGSNADVLVDAGIVAAKRGHYILVVMDESKNHKAIQQLGKLVYHELMGN